ncbi:MAG: T9SS type A sorting domain-containing protein [Bacteroidota bacterium]
MTKTITFRNLAVIMLLAFGFVKGTAQTFWTETFSNQANSTTNWVSGGTNGGTVNWAWTNVLNAGAYLPGNFGSPTASTGYMWFDSDTNGDFPHDVTMTGQGVPVNCTGKTNVHVKFYTQYRIASPIHRGRVGISTDGTTFTYYDIAQFSGLDGTNVNFDTYKGTVDLAIPVADNKPQVWIQFRWEGQYEYYWKVDDLEMYAQATCDSNPLAILCDNFETYTVGRVSPQASWWTPWSGAENTVLSSLVSTDHASDGTKAMKVSYEVSGTTQGNDQLLLLQNKAAGRYELKWKMYIPSGHAGYYNIQNSQTPGVLWNLDVFLDSTGTARIIVDPGTNQTVNATFEFPSDQWFTITHYFDLDNNISKMFINNNLIYGWAYPGNIGGIDFYAFTAWDLSYIDQVEYVSLPAAVFNPDICGTAVDLTQYLGQAPNVAQTTGLYDNTNATVSATDPSVFCWADGDLAGTQQDILNNTMWYTFSGDGNTYHIETVPCSATNYIGSSLPDIGGSNPDGDTQMAIYTGECGGLLLADCNDDLSPDGIPDYRAGLDLQTVPGKNYYMMIDGFDYGNSQVATGQYCVQITRLPNILCPAGSVGSYSLANNGFVCFNANLNEILTLDNPADFVIPNVGPISGLSWALTAVEVMPGVWPPSLGTNYLTSTGFINQPFVVGLANTTTTQPTLIYVTPVVVAGATVLTQATPLRMENVSVDGADACIFVGPSLQVVLMPELTPLSAVGTSTPVTVPPGNNGTIDLVIGGGLAEIVGDPAFYDIQWSNGATTEDLANLAAGTYTVTVSDLSGCTDPVITQISVGTTATKDPQSVKTLTISPNPTNGTANLSLLLNNAADVRIEILNSLGQIVLTNDAGKVNNLLQPINFNNLSDGTYLVRVTIDSETALRKIVLQH